MSENTTIECNKYKFVSLPRISGFIAFDKNNTSIGFDDICKEIDLLEKQLKSARKVIGYYGDQENWEHHEFNHLQWAYFIDGLDESFEPEKGTSGGKKARQWLKENQE